MGKKFDRTANRPLMKAEEGSVYGIITRSLGYSRFQVYCSDSISRIATIRGSMIKRVWMKEGDVVLCSLREGDGKFCDIEIKYTDSEVKTLKEGGYITDQLLSQEDGLNIQIDFSQL
jgi:translation initiation factor 1A